MVGAPVFQQSMRPENGKVAKIPNKIVVSRYFRKDLVERKLKRSTFSQHPVIVIVEKTEC